MAEPNSPPETPRSGATSPTQKLGFHSSDIAGAPQGEVNVDWPIAQHEKQQPASGDITALLGSDPFAESPSRDFRFTFADSEATIQASINGHDDQDSAHHVNARTTVTPIRRKHSAPGTLQQGPQPTIDGKSNKRPHYSVCTFS